MFLIDLLFPKFCLGCGYVGVYLCSSCFKKLELIMKDTCIYCKSDSPYGLTHPSCTKTLNIDGFLCIYHYNPILKKIVKNVKYRLATEVWKDFYKIIFPESMSKLSFYKKLSPDFVIQPIPLSNKKLNERGFNQAILIAKFFNQFLGFKIVDYLRRIKDTYPQAQLTSKLERFKNIQNIFTLRPGVNVNNKKIILIDDVVTSGSTVKEAAKVLKKGGVNKTYVLALAKG